MKPDGACFDRSWREACYLEPIPRCDAEWMIRRHYLGKWPGVVVLTLGLMRKSPFADCAIGVIVFALPPRETEKRYGGKTWELARLWITDSVPTNAESFLISRAVRWIRQHRPDVQALVSYADPAAKHTGVIYRAANWTSDGRTDQERKTPRFEVMG